MKWYGLLYWTFVGVYPRISLCTLNSGPIPVDTGRILNVLCTFSLRPVSTWLYIKTVSKPKQGPYFPSKSNWRRTSMSSFLCWHSFLPSANKINNLTYKSYTKFYILLINHFCIKTWSDTILLIGITGSQSNIDKNNLIESRPKL